MFRVGISIPEGNTLEISDVTAPGVQLAHTSRLAVPLLHLYICSCRLPISTSTML